MMAMTAVNPTDSIVDPTERREHQRVELVAEITATSEANFFAGFTENISEGGVFVSTLAPPDVGETIDVTIAIEGEEPLRLQGVVRWIREDETGPTGCGVQWVDLDPEQRRRLQELVARLDREPLFMELD